MVVIYIVYPHVGVFNSRDVAKRLKDFVEVLQELSTLLGALPRGEAVSPQTLGILQRTVARLYPSTTEVVPVANYPENRHSYFPVPTNQSIMAGHLDFLHNFANRLMKQAELRASGKQLPSVEGPQVDYDRTFWFLPCLPVSVPPQHYAHLAECDHPHSPLAVYLAVENNRRHPSITCTVCSTVSKAAAFVPNQQLTAQEKKELFGSVFCFWCYLHRALDGEGMHYGNVFNGGDGNAQVEDFPEETEVEHQQTAVVQEPLPDAARLNGNCGICRDPLGPHGSIAILSSCGHVFGEACLRDRLATVTRIRNFCPTCGESWDQALIFASTAAPEAKLAITNGPYRKYMASRVFCFAHSISIYFHV